MGNHYDPKETNDEPTQPNHPHTPRSPVKKWLSQAGYPYDSPIEAIEADLQCKAQEVDARLREMLVCRRAIVPALAGVFNRNFMEHRVKATNVVGQLEKLCAEYRLQLLEDDREAKRRAV